MNTVTETWIDILDYEGHYQVSDFGNVRSVKNGKTTVLTQRLDKDGYDRVLLYKPGHNAVNFSKHRLTATLFVPNPKNLPEVNHLDHNKLNNHHKNLEWVSVRENTSHRNYNRKGMMSQYTGVMWSLACNKWTSQILVNKKRVHLGVFEFEEDAAAAYSKALEERNLENRYK